MNQTSILSRDTLIPISAVVVVITAAFSYGIMTQRLEMALEGIDKVNKRLDIFEGNLQQLSRDINQVIGSQPTAYAR